ncbi:MAG: hypothetical protein J4F35_19040 [Candidatus Latescibacteria bacterium]|nr:hypothetical protein [Candidatus Latescibacterota bacterium]
MLFDSALGCGDVAFQMHVRDDAKGLPPTAIGGLFGRCELIAHPAGFFYGIDVDAAGHLADDGFDVDAADPLQLRGQFAHVLGVVGGSVRWHDIAEVGIGTLG